MNFSIKYIFENIQLECFWIFFARKIIVTKSLVIPNYYLFPLCINIQCIFQRHKWSKIPGIPIFKKICGIFVTIFFLLPSQIIHHEIQEKQKENWIFNEKPALVCSGDSRFIAKWAFEHCLHSFWYCNLHCHITQCVEDFLGFLWRNMSYQTFMGI